MSSPFVEDTVGKQVETACGECLGTVVAADESCLTVELTEPVARSYREQLGWIDTDTRRHDLRQIAIARITDETVELRPEFSVDDQ